MAPEGLTSNCYEDYFQILENDSYFSGRYQVIIYGNMNTHIANISELVMTVEG